MRRDKQGAVITPAGLHLTWISISCWATFFSSSLGFSLRIFSEPCKNDGVHICFKRIRRWCDAPNKASIRWRLHTYSTTQPSNESIRVNESKLRFNYAFLTVNMAVYPYLMPFRVCGLGRSDPPR